MTNSDVLIQRAFSEYCSKFCIAFIKYVNSKWTLYEFLNLFHFVKLYKNDLIDENIYLSGKAIFLSLKKST